MECDKTLEWRDHGVGHSRVQIKSRESKGESESACATHELPDGVASSASPSTSIFSAPPVDDQESAIGYMVTSVTEKSRT